VPVFFRLLFSVMIRLSFLVFVPSTVYEKANTLTVCIRDGSTFPFLIFMYDVHPWFCILAHPPLVHSLLSICVAEFLFSQPMVYSRN